MKQKPDLSFWQLWNLSFGFFGVQIAYALQSGNVSRIFSTMGADPKSLGWFWILPPLMGMIVQPIVGVVSDRTWCRFGRRVPYLIAGALLAVIVMVLLPNAGSLSDVFWVAMALGAIILMFLDTSLNMAMQPFKMMVGDIVNEKQKGTAYAIQSLLCNSGQVVGFALPFLMSYIGFSTDATHGVPFSLKMAAALTRVATGVSNCISNSPPLLKLSSAFSMSSADSLALAPESTMMVFSPDLTVVMRATPEGVPEVTLTWVTSIPSFLSMSMVD